MPQKLSAHRKKLLESRVQKNRRPIEPIHPDLQAAVYSKKLQAEIGRGFDLVQKFLFPVLKGDIERLDEPVRADIADDANLIDKTIQAILKKFFGGLFSGGNPNLTQYSKFVAKKFVQPMQKQVDRHHKTQFTKTFKRITAVDPLQFEPELSGFLKIAGDTNVNKIVTQSSKYFDNIKEMTNRALRKGTSAKELADDIKTLTGTTKGRAKLIAIDQVQKLNADLEGQRQQNNGLTRYIWRTRQNARVRSLANSGGSSDHAGLEGAVFDWNFPPTTVLTGKRAGERNHPGQDINCKCWAEPVIEDLTGKSSRTLEAAELKTQKLISQGRIPGYQLPKKPIPKPQKKEREEPEFIPAKNIKDAQAWAEANLKTKITDYPQSNINVVNTLHETLLDFENITNNKLSSIVVIGRKDILPDTAFAGHEIETDILHIRKNYRDVEASKAEDDIVWIKKSEGWGDTSKTPYHSTKDLKGVIWHEIGHALDKEDKWSKKLKDLNIKISRKLLKVSGYSGEDFHTNMVEAWAEAFSAVMTNSDRAKFVPPEVKKIIKESIKDAS